MKLKKRRRYLVSQGTHFSLVCPGATLETVITWLKDGELVTSENEPHITIDIFGTLHVAEVSREDEGNYTCFVDNNRVQDAILLTITQTDLFKEGLLRHMAYLGSIFVLSFTCYCAGCFVAWTRRHHFIGYNRISQEEDGD
ncbi:netrin receptor unc-5-like [Periplaneta americana]|uniref:netrin receptor unc-5-like n=1 Tax=Periplaneta americana TaxID=6978 RepID=UPI0037E73E4C